MHSIQDILSKYIESKDENTRERQPISERHELVSKFSEKINTSRIRDGLKPLPNAFINKKMADASLRTNFDLYWFYKYCYETKNFDKTWWWALRGR